MGFVTRCVDANPDLLMDSVFSTPMHDWLGSVYALEWPGLAYCQVWDTNQFRPRVATPESLADLNCFKV